MNQNKLMDRTKLLNGLRMSKKHNLYDFRGFKDYGIMDREYNKVHEK